MSTNTSKHWQEYALGDVADIVTGATPSKQMKEFFGGDVPFATPSDLDGDGPITQTTTYLTRLGADQVRTIPAESVLVCCIGSLGKVGFAGRELATNQQINSLVFNKSQVFPRYGYHFCRTLKPLLEHMAPATTVAIVNKSKFSSLSIPLPPLSEQKRIADILDKADAIRRKRKEADALLTSARSAVFHDRFGDPVANRKSWNVVELRDLFETSPNYGTMIKPSDEVRGWLDLRVANIQDGKLDLSSRKYVDLPEEMIERHEVREGDLLLARAIGSVEHLGKCIIAHPEDQKWAFDSHLMRIRFDTTRVLPRFVHAFLESPGGRHEFLRNSRRSAVQFNINTKEMACIRMPLPPLEEQQQFIAELDLVDQLSNRQNTASQEHESLFNSLVQRAFKGEL